MAARKAHKLHVKQGDSVQVIAGQDKGKVGQVQRALPQERKVVVEGVNVKTKHRKPQQQGESGQIQTFEAPIDSSNVMLYSNQYACASRIAHTYAEDGRKVRMLKKTGEILD